MSVSRFLVWVPIFALVFASDRSLGQRLAQQPSSFYTVEPEVRFTIGLNGMLEMQSPGFRSVRLRIPQLVALNDEDVRKELDLVSYQDEAIDKLIVDITQKERDWQRLILTGDRQIEIPRLEKEFESVVKTQQEKLDSVLLPHQKTRLAELQARFLIRQNGACVSITKGPIAREIGLDQVEEKMKILQEFRQIYDEFDEKCVDLYKDSLGKLIESLSAEQQEQFGSIRFENIRINSQDIELLRWQLEWAIEQRNSKQSSGSGKDPLDFFPVFKITPSGAFELDEAKMKQDSRVAVSMRYLGLLSNQHFLQSLELSDDKSDQIALIIQDAWRESLALDNQVGTEIREGGSRIDVGARKASIFDGAANSMRKLLDRKQSDQLDAIASQIETLRKGLLFSLVDGQLSKDLKISEKQKEQLVSIAEQTVDTLEKRSREIETEIFERILAALSEEKRSRFEKIIGDPPKYLHANLGLLLRGLK